LKKLIGLVGLCAAFLAFVSCEGTDPAGPEYTVSFRTGGGTPIADKRVPEGTTLDLESYEYQPERRGYRLTGWYVNTDTEQTPVTSIKVTGNIILVAKWASAVSVTLDMKGGELKRDPDSEPLPLPGTDILPGEIFEADLYVPILKGWVFLYWYLADDPFMTEVKEIQVFENITLAARWEKGWVVTFELGDGATLHEGGFVTVAKDSVFDLTTIRPVKEDYVLGGWYYNGNFTGDPVPAGIRVTADITLYAKWVPLSYFEPLFGVWAGSAGTYLLYHDPNGSNLLTGNGLIGFYFSVNQIRSFVWTAEDINGKPWSRVPGTLTVGTDTFTPVSARSPDGNETVNKFWVKGEGDDTVFLHLFETGYGTIEANGRNIWLVYEFIGNTLYLLRDNTERIVIDGVEYINTFPGEEMLALPVTDGIPSGFVEKEFDGEGEGEGVV
jgi:uncharacterized repeat protein (TIGR02543 family)